MVGDNSAKSPPGGKREYVVIAVAAFVTHVAALWAGFIWLDHAHLEDGLALAGAGDWVRLFTHGFAGTGFYRPLMSVSLSLDAALGAEPLFYHATTLAWHAGAAVLTAVAAETLGLSRRAAQMAGLLFAVHPATSLVANAIAFRSESMITVALLGLVVLHQRAKPWAAAMALLAGALTKETALVLGPLFVVALEVFPLTHKPQERRQRLHVLGAEALALVVAIGLRLFFAPHWRAIFADLSAGQAIGTRLAALGKSALAMLLPIDRTICDAFPVTSPVGLPALGGLAVVGFVGYLAYKRRGGPTLLLLLSLLPSLQIVPVMRWWSPHYLYLPLAFVVMLVSQALEQRGERVFRWAQPVAMVLAAVSFRDAFRFQSDERLWTNEVAAQPACREGHFYLAESAREARHLEDAALGYERALTLTPGILSYVDQVPALQNLGVVRLEQERFDDARAAFRGALEAASDDASRRRLTHNLATAELRAGNAEEAAHLLEREVERPDALPASIFIRARAVQALGRQDEADALMRRLPPPPL